MLNGYSIAIWIVAITMLSFAVILQLSNNKPRTKAAVLFVTLASLWATGVGMFYMAIDPETARLWTIYNHFMGIAIATSFYYMAHLINWDKLPSSRSSALILSLFSIVGLSYIAFNTSLVSSVYIPTRILHRDWVYGPLAILHYTYFVSFFVAGFYTLKKHARLASAEETPYVRALERAAIIGVLPIILLVLILPLLGFTNILWAVPFFTLGWIILAAYALVYYRVQSIKLFISEVLVLTMTVLLFANIFVSERLFDEIFKMLIFFAFSIFGLSFLSQVSKGERQQRELITLNQKLRSATDRLAEVNFKLKELSEQKTQFISFASHQIKNPLTSIRGYASLIAEGSLGKVGKKVAQAAETIEHSTGDLVHTVDNFLGASRAELGHLALTKTDLEAVSLLQNIIDLLKADADKKGIRLTYAHPKESLPFLGDRNGLHNALFNVIENALKYTDTGSVNVKLTADKNTLTIQTTDTGIGMSEETTQHLFDRFWRASQTGGKAGSGLGLYLSKLIITEHGGSIEAHSKGIGKGSSISITLPRHVHKV